MSSERIRRPGLWLLAIVLLAASVRLIGLDWDQNHHFHPDERAIAEAVLRLSFDPSTLQLNPRFFAYGSFPFYVNGVVAAILGRVSPALRSYDGLVLVGRAVSAVAGTLTVLLLILLGTRLYNRRVGLLAGFLLAVCVLHVQNSHYAVTDVFLTFMVTVALYNLVGLAQRGRVRDYAYSGLAIGLAAATKFSALPLLAPLGVAVLIRLARERRLAPILAKSLLALSAVATGFAVGQPYALLDFATFSRQIREQGNMVRHAGLMPYTNQYIGTVKYVYEIEQIVLWCMGPALGLAAVWATMARTVGAVRERSSEHLVLLSWVIPYFAVTGWFEVKFLRYLLPIYPFMMLWAAAWLLEKAERSRLGRAALWTVIVTTVAYLLAFMSIYQRPHTVVTASEWVYANVPPGSTLLAQHWDEGFPFSLPHRPPHRLKIDELPYYEGETRMRSIAQDVAQADYIALQTKRLYGAVTRAPDKFPLTTNYFHLLFAGDLGYTLVYDHASRPSLLGFELPDELADESFTVYDHPKVLIFQNTERLSADEILQRVTKGFPSRKLTRDDLLLARANEQGPLVTRGEAPPIRSSWLALLWFVVVIEILGLSAYGILHRWLPVSGSYALAKVLGVLGFAYLSWLLASLGQVQFGRDALAGTMFLLVVAGFLAWRRWPKAPVRPEWGPTELLFWGAFLFFLVVRAFNPEVFWGEKPMDFAFLNALTRTTKLPPPEPWFAGSSLHYSYFGHYVVAAVGKLCHIHPGLTFNLGIAFFGGLTAVGAFALGCALSDRWRVGVLAAFVATLLGNLAGPREFIARRAMNFDYFWATSRVIKDTINEYPFWSFLFADLHAHVLVMPFSLTFLTLSVWWVRRGSAHAYIRSWALLLLLGLTLGAIMVTNTWSSFTYVPFFPFLLGCVWLAHTKGIGRLILEFVPRVLVPSVAVGLLAIGLYYPYWQNWTAPERNWGWENDSFVGIYDYATIFGLFLYILVPYLFVTWRRQALPPGQERLGVRRALPLWLVAVTAVGSLLFTVPQVASVLPRELVAATAVGRLFSSVRTGLVIFAVLAFHLGVHRSGSMRHRLVLLFTSFAFAVTAGCDIIHVWDRMNTIFKFYLEAWLFFSAAAAAAAYEMWRGAIRSAPLRRVWQIGLVGLVGVAVFTGGSAVYGVINTKRVRTPRPTLDGTAYLALHEAHERAAFEWLNDTIEGIPVITEAYGPSYQEYARVSMNTGLPTMLGWDYHVFQRAHPWADINRRKADLETLYTTDNKAAAMAILQKYHVSLVYVGPIERRRYAGGNLERFKEWGDVLTPLYQNAGVIIFGVGGQFTGRSVTTIEAVPHEEGEEVVVQSGPGQLRQPRALAVNGKGMIYVADFDNHRIQVFSPQLEFVKSWGQPGDLPSQFKQPCGIAIDGTDTVYVADTWNQRVQVFNAEGAYQREWSGPFYGPRGIAVSRAGKVYLADTGNHRIRRFDATGREELSWGGKGTDPGQFAEPVGLTTDTAGRVYVCDNGNGRLQIFDADGRPETSFPVPGWESKVFSEPYVYVTAEGTIWVTVPLQHAIRAYDRSGKLLHEIEGGSGKKVLFHIPIGIVYSPTTNELVVTDIENAVVRLAVPPSLK